MGRFQGLQWGSFKKSTVGFFPEWKFGVRRDTPKLLHVFNAHYKEFLKFKKPELACHS
ncbi:MAG: hypothetical protein IT289_08640 [Oligoflexia bacterium]|nr:hypothetical protein [Oligoflexia bacterium]